MAFTKKKKSPKSSAKEQEDDESDDFCNNVEERFQQYNGLFPIVLVRQGSVEGA
ncbi:predicted protein [Arabidopsis lyrata subsp. lyrata]|uniref:Predicted protein n=1 Tax=Arabidopsis lyrata subsp. lyrata TaxID=81972 RepID=D7KFX7_ARALL|nr:predicted protein [Arabidopsis lyrata subsp. lyrata]